MYTQHANKNLVFGHDIQIFPRKMLIYDDKIVISGHKMPKMIICGQKMQICAQKMLIYDDKIPICAQKIQICAHKNYFIMIK